VKGGLRTHLFRVDSCNGIKPETQVTELDGRQVEDSTLASGALRILSTVEPNRHRVLFRVSDANLMSMFGNDIENRAL